MDKCAVRLTLSELEKLRARLGHPISERLERITRNGPLLDTSDWPSDFFLYLKPQKNVEIAGNPSICE